MDKEMVNAGMDRWMDGTPEGWMSGGKEIKKGGRMGIDTDI